MTVGDQRLHEALVRPVNLKEWALVQGVNPQAAYKWFREGTLPVPARRVGPRTILVNPDVGVAAQAQGVGLYARVSGHDHKADLDRQIACLAAWAATAGHRVLRVEAEVGSGARRFVACWLTPRSP